MPTDTEENDAIDAYVLKDDKGSNNTTPYTRNDPIVTTAANQVENFSLDGPRMEKIKHQ